MEESEPFEELVSRLGIIENENRILCLIAVYLGQKADQNTIQGITGILSCLLGKNEQFTTAKTRGLITSMVNGDILEREREKVISSIKVSFHTISPLGYRILLYTLLTYVIPVDPLAIEWDKTKFQDYADSEEKLIFFIIDTLLKIDPQITRVLNSLREGKKPERIKLTKPVSFSLIKTFSGKTGYTVFRVLEDLIWDNLNLNLGLTKSEIQLSIDVPVGSALNKLSGYLMVEEAWGKSKRYRLSIRGISLLPVLALLIKELSVDKSLFQSMVIPRLKEEDDFWHSFTQLGHEFFKTIFRIS